ncbi:MurR/RpiR family transcriptional regulator [Pseudochelatococcus lubricantis]|uniref:MurR/RpiR family transcriptional regulator n=1 Tax=Pseudochelatococcus lubricantis TaxID=1538102 RepID=UPI0035E89AB7
MSAGHSGARGKKRDVFSDRFARRCEELSPSFKRVAAFIDANRLTVLTSSAVDLAREIGTSDATVIRAVQALGFDGLHDLRSEIAASYGKRNAPVDNLRRTLAEASESVEAALDTVLEVFATGLDALGKPAFRGNVLAALDILHTAERIVLFGIGPTAHIAAYFAARLRRKGKKQAVLDRTGAELADQLLDLAHGDALLMLAYGKPYPEAEVALAEARRLRMRVVLVSDSEDTELARRADVVLAVPRGRSERMALHGVTVLCLEMLLLGLATSDSQKAVSTLGELERLRKATRSRKLSTHPGKLPDEK